MSRLLLDTCALLWLAGDQTQLSARARQAIAECAGDLAVSAMSAWEIGIAAGKKRIELGLPPEDWFAAAITHHRIAVFDITWKIGVASTTLPALHPDPCDRIIIATAMAHGIPVVTSDRVIPLYPSVQVIW